jgi:hypothetical protein
MIQKQDNWLTLSKRRIPGCTVESSYINVRFKRDNHLTQVLEGRIDTGCDTIVAPIDAIRHILPVPIVGECSIRIPNGGIVRTWRYKLTLEILDSDLHKIGEITPDNGIIALDSIVPLLGMDFVDRVSIYVCNGVFNVRL